VNHASPTKETSNWFCKETARSAAVSCN